MGEQHMIQGVLFDLDGVIVDTLHHHFLAWKYMFGRYGGSIREETILLHEGRKSQELLPILIKESGIQIPEEDSDRFIEEKRSYYRTIVRVSHYPKAFETVETLKGRGFKIALVTACAFQNMQFVLNPEQQSHFDLIMTGEDVNRAKPFPEPYLTAADRLGLAPAECVVIENAPLGIESAKSAGMHCIAIESTLERNHLTHADFILKNIGELIDVPMLNR
jgi:beta-phosphoglucomutase